MPGPYAANLTLIEETCRQIARGALAIEELGKRYDRTRAALEKAQQIMSTSKELMAPPPVPLRNRIGAEFSTALAVGRLPPGCRWG
jgi:hypothetical protein